MAGADEDVMAVRADVELVIPYPLSGAPEMASLQPERTLHGPSGAWTCTPSTAPGVEVMTITRTCPDGQRVTVHAHDGPGMGWAHARAFRAFSDSYAEHVVTGLAEEIFDLAVQAPGGLSPEDFATAVGAGWTVAQAERAATLALPVEAGLLWQDMITASLHGDLPSLTVDEMLAWHAAADQNPGLLSMDDVSDWMNCGFRTPEERPAGLRSSDVLALLAAQVDVDSGWANGGHGLCPTLIRTAIAAGRSPAESVALMAALHRVRGEAGPRDPRCVHDVNDLAFECGFTVLQRRTARRAMQTLDDVGWWAASACMRAGMSAEEARDYVTSGGEMAAVEVLAALA